MIIVIRAELIKLSRSPVGVIATLTILGGTLAILAAITAAVAAGNLEVTAKLGPGTTADWSGLLSAAAQITAAGGLIGSGVVLTWIFAREFTDGTITGLFALPAGRGIIAAAKLIGYAGWAILMQLVLTVALLGLGLLLGYGAPGPDTWTGLGRQLALGLMTAAIAVPTAWIATLARSLLAGVAATIGLVVIAQLGVLTGAGGWLPLAAPALWALSHGTDVTLGQLAIAGGFVGLFSILIITAWTRLQLDR